MPFCAFGAKRHGTGKNFENHRLASHIQPDELVSFEPANPAFLTLLQKYNPHYRLLAPTRAEPDRADALTELHS